MTSDWEKKCWGETRCRSQSKYYSIHDLSIIKGGYCSFHYHRTRKNVFKVLEGCVRIVEARGWLLSSIIIDAHSEAYTVRAGVPHQFQVIETGRMIEEYLPDPGPVELLDIQRISVGGTVPVNAIRDEDPAIFLHDHFWAGGIPPLEHICGNT